MSPNYETSPFLPHWPKGARRTNSDPGLVDRPRRNHMAQGYVLSAAARHGGRMEFVLINMGLVRGSCAVGN